jgi:hypothetical protein
VLDYWQGFADREQFRVLFLDKRNQLIADEVQQTGTVDHTSVYPREVVKRALELSASAIILVHNHPSGDRAQGARPVFAGAEFAEGVAPRSVAARRAFADLDIDRACATIVFPARTGGRAANDGKSSWRRWQATSVGPAHCRTRRGSK